MKAVILGGAPSAISEFDELGEEITSNADIYVCNDIGTEVKKIDFWCSLHPDQFLNNQPKWLEKRKANGLKMDNFLTVGYSMNGVRMDDIDGVDIWSGRFFDGSSGMFAAGVAYDKGIYDAIILCGVPMNGDVNPYLSRPSFGSPKALMYYRKAWVRNFNLFKGIVFSQGGWTMKLLGKYEK